MKCVRPAEEQLDILPDLEPDRQADLLARLAQEARLVRLAVSASRSDADRAAHGFERALGDVIDADAAPESERAHRGLVAALADLRRAGLMVSARVEELALDGALGMQRLPVLTTELRAA